MEINDVRRYQLTNGVETVTFDNVNYILSGLEIQAINENIDGLGRKIGSTYIGSTLSTREIRLQCYVTAPDTPDREAITENARLLQRICSPFKESQLLIQEKISGSWVTIYYIGVRLRTTVTWASSVVDNNAHVRKAELSLVAMDPYFYSLSYTDEDGSYIYTPFSHDKVYVLTKNSDSSYTLNNIGSNPCMPVVLKIRHEDQWYGEEGNLRMYINDHYWRWSSDQYKLVYSRSYPSVFDSRDASLTGRWLDSSTSTYEEANRTPEATDYTVSQTLYADLGENIVTFYSEDHPSMVNYQQLELISGIAFLEV